MRKKYIILTAVAMIGLAVTVLWPTGIAKIRFADGSSLIIREVTYGTNHTWSSERWHPSLRGSSSLRRVWEGFRDRFRSPPDRLRRIVPFEWNAKSPSIALWGTWDGWSEQPHSLRFVFLDESGSEVSALRMHMTVFRRGASEGLLATATNPPVTCRLRVRVFDDNGGQEHRMLGEFGVRSSK
jgi:hypothetical protein